MPDIAGLKLIVPTSVAGSGVSVSASGKVTFTAATSVSVNGCFTSSYDNYLVVCRGTGPDQPTNRLRLRASGTDATGTDYTRQSLNALSTTVNAGRATTTFTVVAEFSASNDNGYHLYVYGPNLAQPTAMRGVHVSGQSGASIYDLASTHSLSTAYDGFTLYPHSGTLTGALCVYGLSQ